MRIFSLCAATGLLLCGFFAAPAQAAWDIEVYAESSWSPSEVVLSIYADMKDEVRVTSGAIRLLYDQKHLAVKSAKKNEKTWYFTDGVRRFPYADPDYKSRPGEVIISFGIIDPTALQPGVGGKKVLLGTVVLGPAAGSALPANPARGIKGLAFGKGDTTGKYDNFVNTDGILLDADHGVFFRPIKLPKRIDRK